MGTSRLAALSIFSFCCMVSGCKSSGTAPGFQKGQQQSEADLQDIYPSFATLPPCLEQLSGRVVVVRDTGVQYECKGGDSGGGIGIDTGWLAVVTPGLALRSVDAATVDRVKVLADQAEASASQAKIEELEAKLQAAEAKEAAANSEKARKEAEAQIAGLKAQIEEAKKHAEDAADSAVVAEGHKSKAEEHKDAAGVHAAEAKLARDEANAALLLVQAAKADTKGYQDRAVLAEAEAKVAAVAAKLDREQTALAAVAAGAARNQANAAVVAAREQVELAVAEVGKARDEANRSRDEAERAHEAFGRAQKEVGFAKAEVVKARAVAKAAATSAGLAATAADSAAMSADQAHRDAADLAAALQEAREALGHIQQARRVAVAEIDGKIAGLQGIVDGANAHNDAAVAALRGLTDIQRDMARLSQQAQAAATAAQRASANAAAETVGQVRQALQGEVEGIRGDLLRFQDLADVAETKLTQLGQRAEAAEQHLVEQIALFDRAVATALQQVAQVEQRAREVQVQIDEAKNTALQEVGQAKDAAVGVVDGAKDRGLGELEAKKQEILLELAEQAQLARQQLQVSIAETEARLQVEIQQKVAAEQAAIAATVAAEKVRAEEKEREAEAKIHGLRQYIDQYQRATAETEQRIVEIRLEIADAVRGQNEHLAGLRKDIAAMDPHVFLLREWANLTEDPKKQVYPYKDSVKNQKARDVGQLKMEVRNPLPKEIQDGGDVREGWIPGEKFQKVVFGIHKIVEGAIHPKVLAADGSYFLLYEKDRLLWIERRDSLFSLLEPAVQLGATQIQGDQGVQWVFQKSISRLYIGKMIPGQKVETYILNTKLPLNGNAPAPTVTPLAQGEDRLLDMVTPLGGFVSAKGLFKTRAGKLQMIALAGDGLRIADLKLELLEATVKREKATLGNEACLIYKDGAITRLLTYLVKDGKGTVIEVDNSIARDTKETESPLLAMGCVKSEENPSTLVSIRTENGFYVISTENEKSLSNRSTIWKILNKVEGKAIPVLGFMSNINDAPLGRGKAGAEHHKFGVYFVPGKEEFFTFELAQVNGKAWGTKRTLDALVPEVSKFPRDMAVGTNWGYADLLQQSTHDMQFVESPGFKPNVGVVVWGKNQNIYMQLLLLQNRQVHHDVVFDLVGKPDEAGLWKLYNPYPFPVFIRPVANP